MVCFSFWAYFFIEKLIQLDCCKDHLNKALIGQKHVYVYCLFGTGWMRGFFF